MRIFYWSWFYSRTDFQSIFQSRSKVSTSIILPTLEVDSPRRGGGAVLHYAAGPGEARPLRQTSAAGFSTDCGKDSVV